MSAWTDKRKKAAKTLLLMALVISGLSLGMRHDHGDCSNPLMLAVGAFGAWIVVVKTINEALTLVFGWSLEDAKFDRQLRPKFAPRKEPWEK